MTIVIRKGGVQTTIQDLGRYGMGAFGVQFSGPMDAKSLKIANILVRNPIDYPVIEIAYGGPIIFFEVSALIAITGARYEILVNNDPCPMDRPIFIKPGSELTFGHNKHGCRAYLAISGQFNLKKILGSFSTNLCEKFGGLGGRKLRRGDRITVRPLMCKINFSSMTYRGKNFYSPRWFVKSQPYFNKNFLMTLRFMPSRLWQELKVKDKEEILKNEFEVISSSNRMGCRFQGFGEIRIPNDAISRPTGFGLIQIPSDGNPIILTADCQTIGGYPTIGSVISVDHNLLGQLAPGYRIVFQMVSLDNAENLYIKQEEFLGRVMDSVNNKLSDD